MVRIATDDGIGLHVEAAADNGRPPLIFSNSLGTDLHLWDGQAEALADRFRVIRYDTRGHGRSDVPEGEYTIERLGRDVVAILDGLGIDRAFQCGLSLGGMTGQWLAVNAPRRIRRIVMSNTSAYTTPIEMWQKRIDAVTASGIEAIADGIIERWFTPGFRQRAPETVDRIRATLLTISPVGYAGCCAAIRDMDQRRSIRAANIPILIIAGDADTATPPDDARLINRAVVGSRLAIIPDAAHLSNLEQPATYNKLVGNFLAA